MASADASPSASYDSPDGASPHAILMNRLLPDRSPPLYGRTEASCFWLFAYVTSTWLGDRYSGLYQCFQLGIRKLREVARECDSVLKRPIGRKLGGRSRRDSNAFLPARLSDGGHCGPTCVRTPRAATHRIRSCGSSPRRGA